MTPDTDIDVLIVGAGQAGLVTARLLRDTGLTFRLQEAHQRIGDAWRHRYDSLVLFSSRQVSALPGLAMPGEPGGYPGKDEVADYLADYARVFSLPVHTGDGVVHLERADGHFAAVTERSEQIRARAVVVATGGFQEPAVPLFSRKLAAGVVQLTAKTYRNPTQLPPGRTLVAGGGATGRQLARELAGVRETWLSVGRRMVLCPQRILGRDSIWLFEQLGAMAADRDTLHGRLVRRLDATPGLEMRIGALRRAGVQVVRRTVGAEGSRIWFEGGHSQEFASVIWAMGYRDHAGWIRIPGAVDDSGQCLEHKGLSPVPGLVYVGRSWQSSRGSALLCGVHRDAAAVVAALKLYLEEGTWP